MNQQILEPRIGFNINLNSHLIFNTFHFLFIKDWQDNNFNKYNLKSFKIFRYTFKVYLTPIEEFNTEYFAEGFSDFLSRERK